MLSFDDSSNFYIQTKGNLNPELLMNTEDLPLFNSNSSTKEYNQEESTTNSRKNDPFSTAWLDIGDLMENLKLVSESSNKEELKLHVDKPSFNKIVDLLHIEDDFLEKNSYVLCDPLNADCGRMRKLLNFRSTDEVMEKSVMSSNFEKYDNVVPYIRGVREMKRQRRAERQTTRGKRWFGLPAPIVSEEAETDLNIIKYRKALAEPGHFYKGNDRKDLPKYFQFGTVVDSPSDFASDRLPRKQRKGTIVEELLESEEFRKSNKKFHEMKEKKLQRMKGRFNRAKKGKS